MAFKITSGKENLFYGGLSVVIVLLFLFFLSSKSFMYDDEPVMQTPLHTPVLGLDQTSVTVDNWTYNPKKSLMEVIIKTKNTGTDAIRPNLTFKAQQKDVQGYLPMEIVFQDDDLYVIHIKKIPEDYKGVGVHIIEKRDENLLSELSQTSLENENVSSTTTKSTDKRIVITGDYRKMKVDKTLSKKTSFEYISETIQAEINETKEKTTAIKDKEIPLQTTLVETLESEILELTEGKKYETEDEQIATDGKIGSKRNEIEGIQNKQKSLFEMITKLDEKIEKLEVKKADIEVEN